MTAILTPAYKPGEFVNPADMIEIKLHKILYEHLTEEEEAILFYNVDVTKPDEWGFYTWANCSNATLDELGAYNADLKHQLIFYGATDPHSDAWQEVVQKHRKIPRHLKVVGVYSRYIEFADQLGTIEARE
mgnify:FL=1